MDVAKGSLRIGTCSWNIDSWVGLVYAEKSPTAAGYLAEYARRFRTVEIDSWFYRLPDASDVLSYLAQVDRGFSFTAKVTRDISLTHERRPGPGDPVPNPGFLSRELFGRYVERIAPMAPQLDAVMLEFEYLNRDKMPGVDAYMRRLDDFLPAVPEGLPVAIETRNKNYLTREYFQFLRDRNVIHVFSEKLYLPHVYEVYEEFGDLLTGRSVIRLLGGDRAVIERTTGLAWNRIVDGKRDKPLIVNMIKDMLFRGSRVILNVNNHYEGSAPITARYFEEALAGAAGSIGSAGQ